MESVDPEYVTVVRHFCKIEDDVPTPLERQIRRHASIKSEKNLTWTELLAFERDHSLAIVAPSNAGKSTELKKQAELLRAQGKLAIFCDARRVTQKGFEQALSSAEKSVYSSWRDSEERLVLFVDAIDKVPLSQQQKVSDLFRELETVFDGGFLPRVRFVLSVRNGSFSRENASFFARFLRREKAGENAPVPFEMFGMEPLDPVAVRAFATARQVSDVDRFVAAWEQEGVDDLFDVHPCNDGHGHEARPNRSLD